MPMEEQRHPLALRRHATEKFWATENAETLHVTDFTHGREQPRGTVEGGQSLSPGARGTLKRRVFSGLRFVVSPFCRTFALTL